MSANKETDSILKRPVNRRTMLVGTMASGAALSLASSQVFSASKNKVIKVGFVSPQSGKLAGFGQYDPYILSLARDALADGMKIGGETYTVQIINRDSQSDPSRASQLAKGLIEKDHVNLILSTSTPEVTNPVADACEAAGVPNVATVVPWEAFYFGRGAKPGEPSPFKWTYVFSFGVGAFSKSYLATWDEIKTNKKVGVMYPNDADGNAMREHLIPDLEKGGYSIVDPGAYEDGTKDFSLQIQTFRKENCQIINSFPIPADFARFWRQAAQQHLTDQSRIVQVEKTCEFPFQVEALGQIGYRILTTKAWTPVFPYESPALGLSSEQLSDKFEKETGNQWTEEVGTTASLLDVGYAALKASGDPTSRDAIRKAISTLDCPSLVGNVNFNTGPETGVSITPQINSQWLKAPDSSNFKLQLVTIGHANDPNVPIQAKLVPYNA